MEWYFALIVVVGLFLILLAMGMPVAFSFLFVNLVGSVLWWGGEAGLSQLIVSISSSVSRFALMPVPMFILIGEVMFHTGLAPRAISALDQCVGRLPGRLSLLAVLSGTIFATLSGSSVAATATLGSVLTPEMENRGYKKPMSLGPILGSGGLSIMIPPSALGVLLAALAKISVGAILIAIIFPGLLMGVLYAGYIVIRCWLQPSIAPVYRVPPVSLSNKITDLVRYVLPLGLIVFSIIGVIFLGIGTPSEAAALGALASLILAAAYRRLNRETFQKSLSTTLHITVMMLMIFTGSTAFSQILAYTGATTGLCTFFVGLPFPPIMLLIMMQLLLIAMGTFMEPLAMVMVVLPVYLPIIHALHFDLLWFGVIMLLNMEMATTSPPFGLGLFAMKGVAPSNTTMGDLYKAALPFLGCDFIAMLVIMLFPPLTLWLPSLMH
ncbi:MAG: TRAP transporter large permease subunit [Deltaproteobacteria bacterium]|nr:TRAP transporter large permease subunit [Deltaproteobacteria bacterium]